MPGVDKNDKNSTKDEAKRIFPKSVKACTISNRVGCKIEYQSDIHKDRTNLYGYRDKGDKYYGKQ